MERLRLGGWRDALEFGTVPHMEPIDDWRAAALLIEQYGNSALGFAGQRAIDLHEAGDIAGEETWVRITTCIYELQRRTPHEGEVRQ